MKDKTTTSQPGTIDELHTDGARPYYSEMVKRVKGRPAAIKSAAHLWRLFVEFVEFVESRPVDLPEYTVKGNARMEGRGGKVARPLTLQGFMTFCGLGYTWGDFKIKYKSKADFAEVITRVEQAVRACQIEGGLAGVYNSNLTARLNGLSDRSDLTSGGRPLDLKFEIVKPGGNDGE